MNLGYSHEVVFPEPKGIKITVTDQLKIKISGIDRQLVGQVAADIRGLKAPEPYKGKGVKYADERIRRKAGKTGKK
jgi:large subunit ribosomal protein L6